MSFSPGQPRLAASQAWGVDPVGPSGGPPQAACLAARFACWFALPSFFLWFLDSWHWNSECLVHLEWLLEHEAPREGTTAKLTQAIRFFSETAAVFFPSYAKMPEHGARPARIKCRLQRRAGWGVWQGKGHLGDFLLRFIDKFTNIMMTFMAYTNEIDFWKHEESVNLIIFHGVLSHGGFGGCGLHRLVPCKPERGQCLLLAGRGMGALPTQIAGEVGRETIFVGEEGSLSIISTQPFALPFPAFVLGGMRTHL